MGVCTDGNSYGMPDDMVFSFPCICKNGEWKIVDGIQMNSYAKEKLQKTMEELIGEKKMALGK